MTVAEKSILLDVISFSRTNKGLSSIEIILLHQYMQLGNRLTNKIKQKIRDVTIEIELQEWERPETRYNSEYQIEKLNLKKGTWEIVK